MDHFIFIFRINVDTLKDIIQFGYSEKEAALALIQSNNDFNLALDVSNF